jgi:hypothetical protein
MFMLPAPMQGTHIYLALAHRTSAAVSDDGVEHMLRAEARVANEHSLTAWT